VNGPSWSVTRPAGFWIRAVALLIDGLVCVLVRLSLEVVAGRMWGREIDGSALLQSMIGLFTLLFTALYATVLHALDGQTLGKLVVGVRVVDVTGGRLPFGAALLRWFALFVSLMPLGVGFIMAGLRRDKRALHDLIAGSRVERSAGHQAGRPLPSGVEESTVSSAP
jgi:uncharacterized RDD family membrane protein YckC